MRKTQLTDVIHYEKMSQKPNALLIQTLQQTLDGLREFDFKDFIGTVGLYLSTHYLTSTRYLSVRTQHPLLSTLEITSFHATQTDTSLSP